MKEDNFRVSPQELSLAYNKLGERIGELQRVNALLEVKVKLYQEENERLGQELVRLRGELDGKEAS